MSPFPAGAAASVLSATGAEDSAVLPAVIAPPEDQAAKLKTIAHDNATETTFLISEPP